MRYTVSQDAQIDVHDDTGETVVVASGALDLTNTEKQYYLVSRSATSYSSYHSLQAETHTITHLAIKHSSTLKVIRWI
jgi:hypothetical protein